jgi:hypothetical protein
MRNREALRLVGGEALRVKPIALGNKYVHNGSCIVKYVGGPTFCPWIVATDGRQFGPWEVESLDHIEEPKKRGRR